MNIERNTNMRNAFLSARVSKGTGAAIINMAAKAIQRGAGIMKERGWNAHLSFATAKKLKEEGVLV